MIYVVMNFGVRDPGFGVGDFGIRDPRCEILDLKFMLLEFAFQVIGI